MNSPLSWALISGLGLGLAPAAFTEGHYCFAGFCVFLFLSCSWIAHLKYETAIDNTCRLAGSGMGKLGSEG